MSSDTHSASTTLDDIINELKLTYDLSIGLLDGDSLRDIPNLNTLANLNKLLKNLSRELYEVEQVDEVVLNRIGKTLEGEDTDSIKDDEIVKADDSDNQSDDDTYNDKEDNTKRDAGEMDEEDESITVSKRRKTSFGAKKLEDEESSNGTQEIDNSSESLKTDKSDGANDQNGERINSKDDPVPPIQSGSYTHDNDTRLKNPKSEFVTSQTLSTKTIEELGLFSEDNNGLETHGKEYLKKKYGVSSYPENDLQTLLPGAIPSIDFSKNKPPTNQVQFSTFQSYIESYFRPFVGDDIEFLNEKDTIPPGFEKLDYDPNITPFIIPKLGPFYSDVWIDEDATLSSKLNSPGYQQLSIDSYKPKGSIDQLNDESLYTEEISCGPLSSRLFSAILSSNEGGYDINEYDDDRTGSDNDDKIIEHSNDDEDVATKLNSGEDYKLTTEINDFHSIEERLKRELKYIGIFMNLPNSEEDAKLKLKQHQLPLRGLKGSSIIDSDDWIRNKEDDEVCAEIRSLQKQLKDSSARNRSNKKKLIPIVEEQIAYQEYSTILDDLDKQVDQAYMKRLKGKSKKKKPGTVTTTPQQQAVNSGLRGLLEKRRRWIDNIGKLFRPPEVMKRVPSGSVLVKEGDELEEPAEEDNAESTEEILAQK